MVSSCSRLTGRPRAEISAKMRSLSASRPCSRSAISLRSPAISSCRLLRVALSGFQCEEGAETSSCCRAAIFWRFAAISSRAASRLAMRSRAWESARMAKHSETMRWNLGSRNVRTSAQLRSEGSSPEAMISTPSCNNGTASSQMSTKDRAAETGWTWSRIASSRSRAGRMRSPLEKVTVERKG